MYHLPSFVVPLFYHSGDALMKKAQLVLAALMLAGGVTVASAQGTEQQAAPRGPGGRPNQAAMALQGVTLTADQQKKVDSINKSWDDQMQALRGDQSMDQDARRAKMRESFTKRLDALKAVLTDDQKKIVEKNVADMQARMQQG